MYCKTFFLFHVYFIYKIQKLKLYSVYLIILCIMYKINKERFSILLKRENIGN